MVFFEKPSFEDFSRDGCPIDACRMVIQRHAFVGHGACEDLLRGAGLQLTRGNGVENCQGDVDLHETPSNASAQERTWYGKCCVGCSNFTVIDWYHCMLHSFECVFEKKMAWEMLLLSGKKEHPTTPQKKAAPWKLQILTGTTIHQSPVNRGLCPKYLKASEIPCFGSYASCPPAKSWTSDTFQLSNHHPSLKSEPAAALVKFQRWAEDVHGKTIHHNWGWFARLSLMVFVLLQKLIQKFVHHHYHIGSDPKMYKTVALP